MAKRKSPSASSPPPKVKRQKTKEEVNISAAESSGSASVQESVPLEGTPKPGAKETTKLRVKQTRVKRDGGAQPIPVAKSISSIVRSNIQQVLEFHSKSPPSERSTLDRDGDKRHHATVTELAAIAAIIRICNDYEIIVPTPISLEAINEIVVHRFEKRLGDNPSVTHVVLDFSKRSHLEDSILLKVEGYGLAEVPLLEIEFEMLARDTEIAAANNLFRHMQTVYEESDSSGPVSIEYEEAIEDSDEEGNERQPLFGGTKEVARVGVCPAPLMEI
ncbi:uncharacterized protein RCC_02551 [Ramularia collo-cygni]|uniref:Uncharacterized protein n=1 Tax=Ramularia collo-cygni TaxID=112498 RepID=A0A2D3UZN2_9PEZI|nr:uncharacterized protein RCC_02551 [Ramularia collo-cygni]CZT16716.1 uncharacterized protein RCC_02551 [Ramularia collo-cygni]